MFVLGKRPRPMIAKLSKLLISGGFTGVSDISPSPKTPLDVKMQSHRGLKNKELGAVGLGIVAALEKSCDGCCEVLPKFAISSFNLSRSDSIPASSAKNNNCDRLKITRVFEDFESESLENFSYVTSRKGSKNKPITKVYYDGGENFRIGNQLNDFGGFKKMSIFESSSERSSEELLSFPPSDFLSSCHLCRAKLHGKDIYMYRGETAFCSPECRSNQIMIDELKERCRSEASRSVNVKSSSYNTRGQIFSTGIVAV